MKNRDKLNAMEKGLTIGWMLTRQSYRILRANPKLLVFPLCNGLSTTLLLIFLIDPLQHLFLTATSGNTQFEYNDLGMIVLILFLLFCVNTLRGFFACALTDCIIGFFQNKKAGLIPSFSMALTRIPLILKWVLFHTTLGALIRLLGQHANKISPVNKILNGLPWRLAIYFVPSLIAKKRIRTFSSIKESAILVKTTWGATPRAQTKFSLVVLPTLIIALLPAYLSYHYDYHLLIGISISLILFITLLAIHNTAHCILSSALYLYITEGKAPDPFNSSSLSHAFCTQEKTSTGG